MSLSKNEKCPTAKCEKNLYKSEKNVYNRSDISMNRGMMKQMLEKNVLVVGSINVDYVIHTERLPKLGETLTGSGFSMNFGGKGANQAIAVAKAGCHVRMLGAVGRDHGGDLALQNLETFGVDCSPVLRSDRPTGAAVITVCGGDNHIILDEGANRTVTPQCVRDAEELFAWAKFVVLQLEIPVETVCEAAKLAKKNGASVILNPAPVKEVPAELFPFVDWVIPNEFEAEILTGIAQNNDADVRAAIDAFRAKGCGNALITLGKRGCAYLENGEMRRFGVFSVPVADTTAAGDSFIGGLCVKLCEGATVGEAVAYATATSAITVSRRGASASIPTAEEVREFLKAHRI